MKTIEKFYRKIAEYLAKRVKPQTIQFTISVSFTIISVCSMGILGVTLYNRFVNRMEDMTIESSEQLLNQTAINLETYLRNMRRISDAMYYSVIKDKDLAVDSVDEEMNLLYEANKDNLISIACYTNDGKLVAAAPVTNEKDNSDIVGQEWFVNAVDQMENLHFSTPHVQNLFDNATYRYYWVVSLSRAVELTSNGNSTLGVLLVDMNYSSIEQLFNKANTDNSSEYVYLMDSDGEIIYHPKQKLIYTNLYEENNLEAVHYDDGSHQEIFQGEKRLITVKTVSYTGWKIVSVVPMSAFNMGLYGTRMFVIMLMALSMLMIIIINQLVSARIAKPLQRLNESVKEWEAGNLNPTIYVGGSLEVEHLGKTLRSTVEQINQLMHDILYEQEEKRKSELDALQSQINPHFLNNTLNTVNWMIRAGRSEDAARVVVELGQLLRAALARESATTVAREVELVQSYIAIQEFRYHGRAAFQVETEGTLDRWTMPKMILQPLVENAILHGVENSLTPCTITVTAREQTADILLEVHNTGPCMTPEELDAVRRFAAKPKGHGIGLKNINDRLQLYFGSFGWQIDSDPEQGTRVRMTLPKKEKEDVQTADRG